MNKISVSIPGGNGRMGKTLLRLILEDKKYEIANVTCLPNEKEVGIDIGLFAGSGIINKEIKTEYKNSDQIVFNTNNGKLGLLIIQNFLYFLCLIYLFLKIN